MIDFLISKFVRNPEKVNNIDTRNSYGNLASGVGICINLLLFSIKLIAGLLTKSVAIIADAVNNLSDAGSSLIMIVSFKLSSRPADKEHPFGHARMEYLFSTLVGVVIIFVGAQLVLESIFKIRNAEEVFFTMRTAGILLVSIVLKLWLYFFYTKISRKIDSDIVKATATDSIADVVSTSVVLISLVVSPLIGINLDGYMGIIVGILIIKAGWDILSDMISKLVGEEISEEYEGKVKEFILGCEGIHGIHDLIVHDYGPGHVFATVHAEIDAKEDIMKSHELCDRIENEIIEELGIQLTIHMDPLILDDPKINAALEKIEGIVKEVDERLSIHDFRMVESYNRTNVIFDVEMSPEMKTDPEEIVEEINNRIIVANPRYYTFITVDKHHYHEVFEMDEIE